MRWTGVNIKATGNESELVSSVDKTRIKHLKEIFEKVFRTFLLFFSSTLNCEEKVKSGYIV